MDAQVYVHSSSPDEIRFVQEFAKKVLPYFAEKKGQRRTAAGAA